MYDLDQRSFFIIQFSVLIRAKANFALRCESTLFEMKFLSLGSSWRERWAPVLHHGNCMGSRAPCCQNDGLQSSRDPPLGGLHDEIRKSTSLHPLIISSLGVGLTFDGVKILLSAI